MRPIALLAALMLLPGCASPFQIGVPRDRIAADMQAKLATSELTSYRMEKQTYRAIDAFMATTFPEPSPFSTDHDPNEEVWMVYAEGTIAATAWPGNMGAANGPAFSRMLFVVNPLSGLVDGARALPINIPGS